MNETNQSEEKKESTVVVVASDGAVTVGDTAPITRSELDSAAGEVVVISPVVAAALAAADRVLVGKPNE